MSIRERFNEFAVQASVAGVCVSVAFAVATLVTGSVAAFEGGPLQYLLLIGITVVMAAILIDAWGPKLAPPLRRFVNGRD